MMKSPHRAREGGRCWTDEVACYSASGVWALGLACGLLSCLAFVAHSDAAWPEELGLRSTDAADASAVGVELDYRFRVTSLSAFTLDEFGAESPAGRLATHRLRFSPSWRLADELGLQAQADLLSGAIAGDVTSLGAGLEERGLGRYVYAPARSLDGASVQGGFGLREFYLEWRPSFGLFRVGQMASEWGMGLLANDGDGGPGPFADESRGDLVERFLFATKPLAGVSQSAAAQAFFISLAFDVVFRDEQAELMEGDLALQGVFATGLRTDEHEVGVYVARRQQRDEDGDELAVTAVDLAARTRLELDASYALYAQFEGLVLVGETSRARVEGAPERLDVLAGGGALAVGVTESSVGLDFSIESGMASGDADPSDGVIHQFTFDPDHRVGSVLFEEVLSRMSLHASDRIADPTLSAYPVKGFEAVVSNGAVRGVTYVDAVAQVAPKPWLQFALGALWAFAPDGFYEPYQTSLAGGYPVGWLGRVDPGGDLGWEVNAAYHGHWSVMNAAGVRVGLAAGVWFPGDAFDGPDGEAAEAVSKVKLSADFAF